MDSIVWITQLILKFKDFNKFIQRVLTHIGSIVDFLKVRFCLPVTSSLV